MATKQLTIINAKCDHCGKTEEAQAKDLRKAGWTRIKLMTTKVRTSNWVYSDSADLCPACSFEIQEFFPPETT